MQARVARLPQVEATRAAIKRSALLSAADERRLDKVTALLVDGVDVDEGLSDGITALLIGCVNGYCDIVMKLLAANADVNQARNDGATPLFVACGHIDVVTTRV